MRMMMTVAFTALLTGGGLAAQSALPDIGSPPGKLVDVGGRRLHVLCSGAGSPTVVLEAGASAFAIDWTLVQREVARTNRVCAYDRAGSGWSDSSTASTRASASRDLHTLLQAAGEAPPYVMVGASFGGLLVRVYQADYPDDVIGFVLVDPASEDRLFTYFEGQAVAIASLSAEQYRSVFPQRSVSVPRRSPQTGAPFDRLPPALYDLRIKLDTRLIASIPEIISYEMMVSSAEEERARLARLMELRSKQPHPLGDLPTVVLTRGLDVGDGLRETHASLAQLSTNWRHSVIAGAGHEIHLFEPGAVVQAIGDVTEAVRTRRRLPSR
jgi:pimeloyl-ACP methyl ester carboxylesterase